MISCQAKSDFEPDLNLKHTSTVVLKLVKSLCFCKLTQQLCIIHGLGLRFTHIISIMLDIKYFTQHSQDTHEPILLNHDQDLQSNENNNTIILWYNTFLLIIILYYYNYYFKPGSFCHLLQLFYSNCLVKFYSKSKITLVYLSLNPYKQKVRHIKETFTVNKN